jgi:hypothetical protein
MCVFWFDLINETMLEFISSSLYRKTMKAQTSLEHCRGNEAEDNDNCNRTYFENFQKDAGKVKSIPVYNRFNVYASLLQRELNKNLNNIWELSSLFGNLASKLIQKQ